MKKSTLNLIINRFGFETQVELAEALGISSPAVTKGRETKALLNRICRYAAENGHDISDILREEDTAGPAAQKAAGSRIRQDGDAYAPPG